MPGDHGLIFTRGDGHPIDPSDDSEAGHRALAIAELPDVPSTTRDTGRRP